MRISEENRKAIEKLPASVQQMLEDDINDSIKTRLKIYQGMCERDGKNIEVSI
jgi:hypothetical protein